MTSTTSPTERVGRYQLLEPIGIGPSGSVARAKVFGVAGFERQFAVKRFHPELTSTAAMAAMLSAAARAYGSLEHPRIARMSEFGVAQGATFTAVEYVLGLDALRLVGEARLAGVTLAPGGALALVSQAARAVGYAHGRGLTHLGLAPTNVIVTADGDIKITDFGILSATLPQRPIDVARLTQRIPYLAPEQLANEATSAATDVFALGVLAYELVTGTRTFRGETPQQVASAIMAGPPAEPPLPRPIVRVLQRCLARSPFERFPDARALADALDAALRVAPVPGTRKDIGAQVKETLDRLAALNDGQLSGMVALHLGTGPIRRLSDDDVRGASPAAPDPGALLSYEIGRNEAAGGFANPASTVPDLPRLPITTMPGLAPPPIPVPPGLAGPGAPPPGTPPGSHTLMGMGKAPGLPSIAPPGGALGVPPAIPPIKPRAATTSLPPRPPAVPPARRTGARTEVPAPTEPASAQTEVSAIHALDPSDLVHFDDALGEPDAADASFADHTVLGPTTTTVDLATDLADADADPSPTAPFSDDFLDAPTRARTDSRTSRVTVPSQPSAVPSASSPRTAAAGPASQPRLASPTAAGPASQPRLASPTAGAGPASQPRLASPTAGAGPASQPRLSPPSSAPTLGPASSSGPASDSVLASSSDSGPASQPRLASPPGSGPTSQPFPAASGAAAAASSSGGRPSADPGPSPDPGPSAAPDPSAGSSPSAAPGSGPSAAPGSGPSAAPGSGPSAAPGSSADPSAGSDPSAAPSSGSGPSAAPSLFDPSVDPADRPTILTTATSAELTDPLGEALDRALTSNAANFGDDLDPDAGGDRQSSQTILGFAAPLSPPRSKAGTSPSPIVQATGPVPTLPQAKRPLGETQPEDVQPEPSPQPPRAAPAAPAGSAPAVAAPPGWITAPPRLGPPPITPLPGSSKRSTGWVMFGLLVTALVGVGAWQVYVRTGGGETTQVAAAPSDARAADATQVATASDAGPGPDDATQLAAADAGATRLAIADAGTSAPADATKLAVADAGTVDAAKLAVADAGAPRDALGADATQVAGTPASPGDTLAIASTPPGARVFLDGADTGATPIKLPGTPDRHTIALMLPSHELYVAQVDGHGAFQIPLKEVTPTNGPAGIKVMRCKPDRYYVFVDGKPTGQICPTERIGCEVGAHTVEVYDVVSETRRKWDIVVKDTRLSFRVRVD